MRFDFIVELDFLVGEPVDLEEHRPPDSPITYATKRYLYN